MKARLPRFIGLTAVFSKLDWVLPAAAGANLYLMLTILGQSGARSNPFGVAVDRGGNLYAADYGYNHALVFQAPGPSLPRLNLLLLN